LGKFLDFEPDTDQGEETKMGRFGGTLIQTGRIDDAKSATRNLSYFSRRIDCGRGFGQ
jgi:hypothetical protein